MRATYRLQLGGEMGFAQARELLPYLRDLGVSHLYLPPSFQARAGLHARLRRRRPDAFSEELGGEREFDALAAARAAARPGADPRRRPQPHGDRRRQPLLGRPGAAHAVLRHRRAHRPPPPVLRRRPPGRRPPGGRARLRRDAQAGAAAGARGHGRRPARRPSRRARRPGRLPASGCATAAPQHVWVEKILDPGEPLRDWPVEGTVGYEFLNDVAALFVDPAGEAPLTDLWVEISGDDRPFGEVAFEAKLEQVRGPFAPEADRLRREAPREVGGLERTLASLPGLPHLRRAVVGQGRGRRPRGDPRGRAARVAAARADAGASAAGTRSSRASSRRRRRSWPRASRTPRSTATRGCWRSERRRRRPEPLRDLPVERVPRRQSSSVRERFPHNLLSPRRTTPSARATCGPGSARSPGCRTSGRRACAAGSRRARRCAGPDAVERYFIFQTLVGAWPIEPERLVAYIEKALREAKRHTNWIEPDTAHEDRVKCVLPRAVRAPAVPVRLRAVRRRGRPRRRPRRARPAAAQAHRARRAGHLPGRRAAGAVARGSRQPPPGRLGAPARAARRGPPRRGADRARRASCG